jgi:hypothetical protein
MEKVIYILWRNPAVDMESFAHNLRNDISDKLLNAGVRGLQVNVVDDAVSPAQWLRYVTLEPQMEAVLHVWMECAMPRYRQPIDDIVAQGCDHFWAYLVTEAQSRRNIDPVPLGTRSYGMAQMGFGMKPANITIEHYLEKMCDYTPIALECQPLFYLQQNIVTRVLTPGARPYASMVEECFPDGAMTDPDVFFAGNGDGARKEANQARIMAGIKEFVDFDTVDVIPTSQYIMKRAF